MTGDSPTLDPVGDPPVDPKPSAPAPHLVDPTRAPPVVDSKPQAPAMDPTCAPPVVDSTPPAPAVDPTSTPAIDTTRLPLDPLDQRSFEIIQSFLYEKGFLNYLTQCPSAAMLSSEIEEEPSKFQKFSEWFMKKVDPEDIYLKKFVKMVYELNGITIDECKAGIAGPVMGRRILLALGRIQPAANKVQKQGEQILEAVKNTEKKTEEGVELLKEVKDMVGKVDRIAKYLENSAGKEVEETVISDFVSQLDFINNHEISKAAKQVDTLVNNITLPFSVRERFLKIKDDLVLLAALINGLSLTLPATKDVVKPTPSPISETVKPVPAKPTTGPSRLKTASGPCQFSKLGKIAKDVLHKDFHLALHADLNCKFSKAYKKDPTVFFKIGSTPSVKAIIAQKQLWGSDVNGALSLRLPWANNTTKAKFHFQHDRLSLNVCLGLHAQPHLKIGVMAGSNQASGGGSLEFNTTSGEITALDIGGTITDPELGTLSTVFKLTNVGQIDPKHGTYKAYYSKTHKKNTIAAELEYKYVEVDDNMVVEGEKKKSPHTVAGCLGVLHQFDSGLMLKANVSSTGHASGMIQFSEGLADSIVRATVRVDLRHLDRPPMVGFSISSDPTK